METLRDTNRIGKIINKIINSYLKRSTICRSFFIAENEVDIMKKVNNNILTITEAEKVSGVHYTLYRKNVGNDELINKLYDE